MKLFRKKFLFYVLIFILVSLFSSKSVLAKESDDVYDIILFWGQSNMVGYSGIREGEKLPDIRYLTEANTGISQSILNRTRTLSHVDVPLPNGIAYDFHYTERNGNPLVPITSRTEHLGETLLYQDGELIVSGRGNCSLARSCGTNMIPQFCATYYRNTGHKVIAVLAGHASMPLSAFLPATDPLYTAKNDVHGIYEGTALVYKAAVSYAEKQNLNIGSKFWVSFQGESDIGKISRTTEKNSYKVKYRRLADYYKKDLGLEYGFLIETGAGCIGSASEISEKKNENFQKLHILQEELIRENNDIMLATAFPYIQFYNYNTNVGSYCQNYIHFTSAALSEIGLETALNASQYANGGFVKSITMSETKKYIEVGRSKSLSYTVRPNISLKKNVIWRSSNPEIAKVDSKGTVTALKEGTANIYVQTKDGRKSAFCTVTTRSRAIYGVKLSKKLLNLLPGESQMITASILPSYGENASFYWNSSDKSVASVKNGEIVAKKKGTAIISVITGTGGYTDYCIVNVNSEEEEVADDIAVTAIKFSKTNYTLNVGDQKYILPDFTPMNASNRELEWKVANESVLSIDEKGFVKANSIGKSIIYATSKDGEKMASTTITVKPCRISSIYLSESSVSLAYGDSIQLESRISPEYASNKNLVYDSSNSRIVKVSDTGLMKAVGIGMARIFVMSNDGSEIIASCDVEVTRENIYANSITVSAVSDNMDPDTTMQMNAFILPSDTTNKNVIWRVDDTEKGFINAKGVLYVKKDSGCQTITVTATTKDGSDLSGSYEITINPPKIETLKIGASKGITNLAVGNSLQIKKEIKPDKARDNQVCYRSSNTNYATVSSTGIVTAKALGVGQTVTIVAKAMDGSGVSARYKITIRKDSITNIFMNPTSKVMKAGTSMTINTLVGASGGDVCEDLYWKSSDPSIVKVSNRGVVTALPNSEGKVVTISAYAMDGSKVCGTCCIRIK